MGAILQPSGLELGCVFLVLESVVPTIDVSSFDAKHSHPDILNPIAKVDPPPVPLLTQKAYQLQTKGQLANTPRFWLRQPCTMIMQNALPCPWNIVPLTLIEYGAYGGLIHIQSKPYSIYLLGLYSCPNLLKVPCLKQEHTCPPEKKVMP